MGTLAPAPTRWINLSYSCLRDMRELRRLTIRLARSVFEKWEQRGAWRPTADGTISVILPFGIDTTSGGWTDGNDQRGAADKGFSHPDNKANMVAMWLLAMFDATGDLVYSKRAGEWFRVMQSRGCTSSAMGLIG
jgi:hypothetical protein